MTKAEKLMLIGMYIAAGADVLIALGLWLYIIC